MRGRGSGDPSHAIGADARAADGSASVPSISRSPRHQSAVALAIVPADSPNSGPSLTCGCLRPSTSCRPSEQAEQTVNGTAASLAPVHGVLPVAGRSATSDAFRGSCPGRAGEEAAPFTYRRRFAERVCRRKRQLAEHIPDFSTQAERVGK